MEPPNDAVSIDQELSHRLVPRAFPVVSVSLSRLEAVEAPQCLCPLPEAQGVAQLAGWIAAHGAHDLPRRIYLRESIRLMSNEGGVNGDCQPGRMISIIKARVVPRPSD